MTMTHTSSESSFTIPMDEYAKFIQYERTIKIHLTLSQILQTRKSTTCLLSSSSKWVIGSNPTNHMLGTPCLFSNFQLRSLLISL